MRKVKPVKSGTRNPESRGNLKTCKTIIPEKRARFKNGWTRQRIKPKVNGSIRRKLLFYMPLNRFLHQVFMKKKECPSCAMPVDEKSKVCPVCGYEFPS